MPRVSAIRKKRRNSPACIPSSSLILYFRSLWCLCLFNGNPFGVPHSRHTRVDNVYGRHILCEAHTMRNPAMALSVSVIITTTFVFAFAVSSTIRTAIATATLVRPPTLLAPPAPHCTVCFCFCLYMHGLSFACGKSQSFKFTIIFAFTEGAENNTHLSHC